MRKLHKDFTVELEVITQPDQIARFLRCGEALSRMTYQWHVGQRLVSDAANLAHYRILADQNRMGCYLMSLDGQPPAFLRGTVEGKLYHYETPGFDPTFGNTSIGTVLLLRAVQDLIDNTSCTVFDFGIGADETGYKSSFGLWSVACRSYAVVVLNRPRGLALLLGQGGLNVAKNAANGPSRCNEGLRHRMKTSLRKYGN